MPGLPTRIDRIELLPTHWQLCGQLPISLFPYGMVRNLNYRSAATSWTQRVTFRVPINLPTLKVGRFVVDG
jgi:hypothetical protein